jgi:hypothetical protein
MWCRRDEETSWTNEWSKRLSIDLIVEVDSYGWLVRCRVNGGLVDGLDGEEGVMPGAMAFFSFYTPH